MRISVLLPVFNGLLYLDDSIYSVLSQSHSDFEFLILDDNSTDGSFEFISRISDNRVKVLKNETNKGLFFSLNRLVGNANGELIILWCQDDIMLPNALEIINNFHKENPEIAFCYAGRKYINNKGQVLKDKSNSDDLTPSIINPALHIKIAWFTGSVSGNISTLAFKRQIFEQYGLFREDFIYSADFEFQIRVGLNESIGRINDVLFLQRIHDKQLSAQVSKSIYQLKEDLYVFDLMLNSRLNTNLIDFGLKCMKWKRSNYYLSVLFNLIKNLEINQACKYFSILFKHPLITINPFYFLAYYFGFRKHIKLFN